MHTGRPHDGVGISTLEEATVPISPPEERPDIYDDYDFPPEPRNLSPAYIESVMPDHLRREACDTEGDCLP